MEISYKKPPILDVVCEIQFDSENWDVLYFADFYDKVKEQFPNKTTTQQGLLPGGILFMGENSQVEGNTLFKRDFLRCSNPDNTIVTQFGQNVLTVGVTTPYMGWTKFGTLILDIYRKYIDIAKPVRMKRVNLKYQNKINSGEKHSYENLCSAFNFRPNMPNAASSKLTAVNLFTETYSEDNLSVLALQQVTLRPDDTMSAPVLFNLDYICLEPKSLLVYDNFVAWLEEAHTTIHNTFMQSVANTTKQNFD